MLLEGLLIKVFFMKKRFPKYVCVCKQVVKALKLNVTKRIYLYFQGEHQTRTFIELLYFGCVNDYPGCHPSNRLISISIHFRSHPHNTDDDPSCARCVMNWRFVCCQQVVPFLST